MQCSSPAAVGRLIPARDVKLPGGQHRNVHPTTHRVFSPSRLVLALALAAPFATPRVSQPTVVGCNATAYVNDPDPTGTNLRRGADAKSAVALTITDSDSELDITGSLGDWLRVRKVRSVEGKATFTGEGWVYARLTAVRARGVATLRATPEHTAAAVAQIQDEDQVQIVGCRGDWLRVKYKSATGWLDKASRCGNPVTTCS